MHTDFIAPDDARRLRDALAGPGPSVILVSGLRGVGKTSLLHHVTSDDPSAVYYLALDLPDLDHRRLLVRRLEGWAGDEAPLPGTADWPELLTAVADVVDRTRRRLVLVLDDAHRLVASRRRVSSLLAETWTRAVRARGLPIHLVLAGRSPHLGPALGESETGLGALRSLEVRVEPLDFRRAAARVGGYAPVDRLRTWAVFGGHPLRLRHVDPSVTLTTNIQRTVLDPEGPLFLEGMRTLEDDLSSVARYVAVLRALGGGALEWGRIVEKASGVESGGQIAPYLARLEELGLVRAERSLDAGPRTRRRRYRIRDPFLAFWHRSVLPRVSQLGAGQGAGLRSDVVRGELDAHMSLVFPMACREYLRRYADERLPAVAREVGGLWGDGYDMEVSGTLRTGPVVYGRAFWRDEALDREADDALAGEVRSTRYGFGREARIRLLVSRSGFAPDLSRRAARDRLLHLVGIEDLVGG